MTASRRLARGLREANAKSSADSEQLAWATPDILPWPSFLLRLWQSVQFSALAEARSLLSDSQSLAIWDTILHQEAGSQSLLNTAAMVRQLAASWANMCEYGIALSDLEPAARSADNYFLFRCVKRYIAYCDRNNFQCACALGVTLCELIPGLKYGLPDSLEIRGFDRFTPTQQRLLDALQEREIPINVVAHSGTGANARRVVLPDRDSELRHAGAWAREKLEKNSSAKLAIIVPTLSDNAPRDERLIRETFMPGWQRHSQKHSDLLNVSYGRPIAEYPMVASALDLLRAIRTPPRFADLSAILRSAYFSGGSDPALRADRERIELALRDYSDRDWPLKYLPESLLETCRDESSGDFLTLLRLLGEQSKQWRANHAPAHWATKIRELLSDFGWASAATLSSFDYQLLSAWNESLDQLAALGAVHRTLSGTRAISFLEALARNSLFQAQATSYQVQLIGPLEAAGLHFDGLWITGMDAQTWPPPQRPDPLLPVALQKRFVVADSSPENSLENAQRVLARLLGSADEVIVSNPRADGDAVLQPSPLVNQFAETEVEQVVNANAQFYAQTLTPAPVTKTLASDVPLSDNEVVRGGVRLLEQQRYYPFAAFSEFRLLATPIPEVRPGLSPMTRGIILHKALELVFNEFPSQQSLREAQPQHLQKRIESAIERAQMAAHIAADELLRYVLTKESHRCKGLIRRFVECELSRPEFRNVVTEKKRELELPGLILRLKIDRIDEVDSGTRIIDYKTGAKLPGFVTARMEFPQLQLIAYAMTESVNPDALILASVNPRSMVYAGVSREKILPGETRVRVIDEWNDAMTEWQNEIRSLGAAFSRGDLRVSLLGGVQDHRAWATLSRVHEWADL